MSRLKGVFLDVGGVCLGNGWDQTARRRAAAHFSYEFEEGERRHECAFEAFERGEITRREYLDRVIFYRERSFSHVDVVRFMEGCSTAHKENLEVLRRLRSRNAYAVATINNESLELNLFRIERFGLRACFSAFFSSCFLGVRKPDPRIFQIALRVMQWAPGECLFLDDREENVSAARSVGIEAVRLSAPERLPEELRGHGVVW